MIIFNISNITNIKFWRFVPFTYTFTGFLNRNGGEVYRSQIDSLLGKIVRKQTNATSKFQSIFRRGFLEKSFKFCRNTNIRPYEMLGLRAISFIKVSAFIWCAHIDPLHNIEI